MDHASGAEPERLSDDEAEELEQIILGTFHQCDSDKTGQVKASRIVDCLKEKASSPDFPAAAFLKLRKLLDPRGCDAEVDFPSFQSSVESWVERLQSQETDQSDTESVGSINLDEEGGLVQLVQVLESLPIDAGSPRTDANCGTADQGE